MTPLTREFRSGTQAGFSPSVSSRVKNGDSQSVWDLLERPYAFVGPVIMALGSLTHAPYLRPPSEFSRTVAFSHAGWTSRRRGVRISLREARELALRVMADAERDVRKEREREVLFLRGPADEESATHDL